MATLGVVKIPGLLVEPISRLRSVYIGVENLARGDAPKGQAFADICLPDWFTASALRPCCASLARFQRKRNCRAFFSFNLGGSWVQILIAATLLP